MSRLLLLSLLVTAAPPRGNPLVTHALTRPETLAGHVVERVPAGSYLYLRLVDAQGTAHWVATLRRTAPTGDDVRVTVFARAETFHSSRLSRDFSPLSFGPVSPAVVESP
ncbi:MAG: hypothetical protein GQE15_11090 [Archangiaceae bacterium]|nr:hypothetical protein [Archangiaceae bacterium]